VPAGQIPLHDEEATYAKQTASLKMADGFMQGWDQVAVSTAFKCVALRSRQEVYHAGVGRHDSARVRPGEWHRVRARSAFAKAAMNVLFADRARRRPPSKGTGNEKRKGISSKTGCCVTRGLRSMNSENMFS
jgi:hypothetical protein